MFGLWGAVGQHRSRHKRLSSVSAVRYNEAAHHSLASQQWGAVLAPHTMTLGQSSAGLLFTLRNGALAQEQSLAQTWDCGPAFPTPAATLQRTISRRSWKIRFTLLCSLYLLQNAISMVAADV